MDGFHIGNAFKDLWTASLFWAQATVTGTRNDAPAATAPSGGAQNGPGEGAKGSRWEFWANLSELPWDHRSVCFAFCIVSWDLLYGWDFWRTSETFGRSDSPRILVLEKGWHKRNPGCCKIFWNLCWHKFKVTSDVISKVTMIDYWMCFETCEDMESTILVTGESIKSFQSEVAAVSMHQFNIWELKKIVPGLWFVNLIEIYNDWFVMCAYVIICVPFFSSKEFLHLKEAVGFNPLIIVCMILYISMSQESQIKFLEAAWRRDWWQRTIPMCWASLLEINLEAQWLYLWESVERCGFFHVKRW